MVGLMLGLVCSPWATAQQPTPGAKPPVQTKTPPKPKELTAAEKAAAAEKARFDAEQQRLKPVKDAITKTQSKISQIILSGVIAPQDKPDVDQFFNNQIELMISFGEAPQAQAHRQKIRSVVRQIGNAKQEKSALAAVNAFLLQRLSEIAWEGPVNRHSPHARYMCMLALGDLNAEEPTLVGAGTVKPMPEALPELHKVIEAEDALAAVKVAALVGILRHAKAGIDDKAREKKLVVDLATLVKQTTPPEGETVDGQQWMRRQAIEILGVLKQAGPNNEAIEPLVTALLDKTEPINLRLDAARALGQIKVPANALGEDVTAQLGELTLELLRNEPNRRALRMNLLSLQMGLRAPMGRAAS